ncbi:MAG: phage virion morphogenesis protein [Pseudomonadota bacterium]
MALRITHKAEGFDRAQRAFRELGDLGADPRELLEAIGAALTDSTVERLAVTNTSPDGVPWPQSRRAQVTGGPTQFDSGMAGLAGSITHNVIPSGVEIGSPLVYAAQRQEGGTIRARPGKRLVFKTWDSAGNPITIFAKQVTQPARPYLGVSAEDQIEIEGLALDALEEALSAGGAR